MENINSKYEPVIGLEIHAQLKTMSKAFCKCSTNFHSAPNSNVCPVCLGFPGTLPVLNKNLVEYTLKMGLATNCKVRENSFFARKNYFYPDLTKGYQISQFETPICYDGYLNIKLRKKEFKKIGITRIHMEEDAGKSIHDFHDEETLIDFNRCGVPLIEIVSEPDLNSTEEVYTYLCKVKQILIYLDINDGNMEEGSLRCDANVSVKLKGTERMGTRTEIKNLNSFKNVVDAIESEVKRQINLIEAGEKVSYHTMTYNAKDKKTFYTRTKEEAHDYRYFPEPDLVKVSVRKEWIDSLEKSLGELPDERINRFIKFYSLIESDAEEIVQDKSFADYFEKLNSNLINKNEKSYRIAGNIMRVDVRRVLNEKKININEFSLSEKIIARLADSISSGNISVTASKEIFNEVLEGKTEQEQNIIFQKAEERLSQVSNSSQIEKKKKKSLKIIQKKLSDIRSVKKN